MYEIQNEYNISAQSDPSSILDMVVAESRRQLSLLYIRNDFDYYVNDFQYVGSTKVHYEEILKSILDAVIGEISNIDLTLLVIAKAKYRFGYIDINKRTSPDKAFFQPAPADMVGIWIDDSEIPF